jgi:glyoxylase-like metal-dependent hydrolase (beta-lactamase superfamily II)
MRTWGVPEDRVAEAAMSEQMLQGLADLATPDIRIQEGEIPHVAGHTLTAMATPGHTPGHTCFWDHPGSTVYSGDHVLPRITPNVSLSSQSETNPLERYLESLRRIARHDDYEVCPAHEYRFRGMARRANELESASLARIREVHDALERGATSVHDIARVLTWSRGWPSLKGTAFRLALGEQPRISSTSSARAFTTGFQDYLT